MSNVYTAALTKSGVSIWLDDLTRQMLETGTLENEISNNNIVGITTNPSIFSAAISTDPTYRNDIYEFAKLGLSPNEIITKLTVQDVQRACDILQPVYAASDGLNGRVSLEVEPELAHDTVGTVARATELWKLIDRSAAMIKIPATEAGLAAITATVAKGISVNVTLIFSITRYRQVASAYMHGLELALENGIDISKVQSVASIFVSRFDTAVAAHKEKSSNFSDFHTRVGVANAKLVYSAAAEVWATERAKYLRSRGANEQRLLWASTGVKDDGLIETYYVSELVGEDTVNTMPTSTLRAVQKGLDFNQTAIQEGQAEATSVLQELNSLGINYKDLTTDLEAEGLEKFVQSWTQLIKTVSLLANGK